MTGSDVTERDLAFREGWPNPITAIAVVKEVFRKN
jgi:hypothetical protein